MIYDMYVNDEITIFRFDPKEPDDDECISVSELSEPEHENGFINGVKLMDDFDIREQMLANELTGGHWDPEIHWIVLTSDLLNLFKQKKWLMKLVNKS
jgi:hypothetical protein